MDYFYFERTPKFKADTSKQYPLSYYKNLLRKLSSYIEKKIKQSGLVIARYMYSIPALIYAMTGKRVDVVKDVVDVVKDVIEPDYIIYCYAKLKILEKRIKERESLSVHEKDLNKFKRLCKRYKELFENKKNVIKIDTSNKTVEESVEEVLQKLQNRI